MLCGLVWLISVLCVFACSRKHKATLYLPAEETSVSIDFSLPVGVVSGTSLTFEDVCHGTRAYLVSFGNADSAAAWDYRFLLDTAGNLFGCASGPCSGKIQVSLSHVTRAMFEGIDVSADAYAAAADVNIVCRGIADSRLGMGQIVNSPVPTPSATSTTQPPALSAEIAVHIPLLRIGEFNPTFTTASPIGGRQAAATLSFSPARSATGGMIVVGGSDNADDRIFRFDPTKISVAVDAATLSEPRIGPRAVAFLDSAGRPAVLFAGGQNALGNSINSMDVVRLGAPPLSYPSHSDEVLENSVGFYLPRHKEAGVLSPAVVLIGGAHGATYSASYQYFFPSAPADISSCLPGAFPGKPSVCRPGSGVAMPEAGHVKGVAARIENVASDQVLIAMGVISPSDTISGKSYLFDPEVQMSSAALPTTGAPAFAAKGGEAEIATARLSSNYVGFFGNFDSATGQDTSRQWGFFSVKDSRVSVGTGLLLVGGPHSATALLDGRVVFVGEDRVDEQVVELYVPAATSVTAGTFAFMQRFDIAGACTTGHESACVRSLLPRSYHTAMRIDSSLTWLNGAVVVIGGTSDAPAGHGAEIFVPAYACNGETAVMMDGTTPVPGVDFCDRARMRQSITDPSAPALLTP